MDEIDRKILYEIAENADESKNKISKKIRCSREVLDYRIKKLEKEGIILGYQARINISNFIYGGYILLVQSTGLNEELESKIIEKIKSNKKIQYIGKIGGEYDFIISFTIKNLNELSETIDYISNSFGKNKLNFSLLTMIEENKDSFKTIFTKNDEKNQTVSMPKINQKVSIDETDRKILVELRKRGDIVSWKIAEKIKISDVAVRKRIEKLIEKKLILSFRTMIDLTKLNYQPFFLLIKTNAQNNEFERKMIDYFETNRKITYSTRIAGRYDYIITILVENNSELKDFTYKLKNNFSQIITELNIFPLFEMIYHTQIAEDFLK